MSTAPPKWNTTHLCDSLGWKGRCVKSLSTACVVQRSRRGRATQGSSTPLRVMSQLPPLKPPTPADTERSNTLRTAPCKTHKLGNYPEHPTDWWTHSMQTHYWRTAYGTLLKVMIKRGYTTHQRSNSIEHEGTRHISDTQPTQLCAYDIELSAYSRHQRPDLITKMYWRLCVNVGMRRCYQPNDRVAVGHGFESRLGLTFHT